MDSLVRCVFSNVSALHAIALLPAVWLRLPLSRNFSAHASQSDGVDRLACWLARAVRMLWSPAYSSSYSTSLLTAMFSEDASSSKIPALVAPQTASEFGRAYSQRLLQRMLRTRTRANGAEGEALWLALFFPFPNMYVWEEDGRRWMGVVLMRVPVCVSEGDSLSQKEDKDIQRERERERMQREKERYET